MTKGEETRSRIEEAAFNLFTTQGYHGSSMRQIAAEAGLTPASIYNHFNGKEDIFVEVFVTRHPIREILPILEDAEGETAEELIHNITGKVYKMIHKRKELLYLLFVEIVEFEGRHLNEIYKIGGIRVLGFIDKLRKTRSQFRDISSGNLFISILGLMLSQWMLETSFTHNVPLPGVKNHFEVAVDIFLHGILAEGEQV